MELSAVLDRMVDVEGGRDSCEDNDAETEVLKGHCHEIWDFLICIVKYYVS